MKADENSACRCAVCREETFRDSAERTGARKRFFARHRMTEEWPTLYIRKNTRVFMGDLKAISL